MNRDDAHQLSETVDSDAARQLVRFLASDVDGFSVKVWGFGIAEGPSRAVAMVAQIGAELSIGAF